MRISKDVLQAAAHPCPVSCTGVSSPTILSLMETIKALTSLVTVSVLSFICTIGCSIHIAYGFDNDECSQLIRGCLTRSTTSRDLCFQSAAASPLCIGSAIGDIASQRARFSPFISEGEDEGPAFLGPQVSDRSCLDNFDLHLGITLDLGPLTPEKRESLSSQLERCSQPAPSDLYRP